MTEQLSLFERTTEEVRPPLSVASATIDAKDSASARPFVYTAPFSVNFPARPAKQDKQAATEKDAALFGILWPLGAIVKLDATVERRVLRQQSARLNALGYKFAPLSQDWHLASN